MKKMMKLLFVMVMMTIVLMQNAYAYLDPATTTYIIQIAAGIVIALGASVGIFWKRIRLFFRKRKMQAMERKISEEAKKREQNAEINK